MTEKMLITQALDERDLLVKKIQDKIAKSIESPMEKAMVIMLSLLIGAAVITVDVLGVKEIGHTNIEKGQQV